MAGLPGYKWAAIGSIVSDGYARARGAGDSRWAGWWDGARVAVTYKRRLRERTLEWIVNWRGIYARDNLARRFQDCGVFSALPVSLGRYGGL